MTAKDRTKPPAARGAREFSDDIDKRALKILLGTYWSSAGWKPKREQKASPEDFAYAKKMGLMFEPIRADHAIVIARLTNACERLTPQRVGDAFLASLSTRRLDWRSAWGSYGVFRHLHEHAPIGSKQCAHCGLYLDGETELSVLSFERHKWGGVRHASPDYAMLDLESFLTMTVPKPAERDVALFGALIAAIDAAPANTTSSQLHGVFPRELAANKAERDRIVAMLGFCGALGTKAHPGHGVDFISSHARAMPDRHHVDMDYPACWWRRADGFDREALRPYFGHAVRQLR